MELIDSHCHLHSKELVPDLDKHISEMHSVSVNEALCVSIEFNDIEKISKIVEKYKGIYSSIGVHPGIEYNDISVDDIINLYKKYEKYRVLAIGETGLDYFKSHGDLEWQRNRFRMHIRAALELNLPIIIHNRESTLDIIRILKEESAHNVGGVFHCYTEDLETSKIITEELGFYISFSGIITFKNSDKIKEAATYIDINKILVETDSPYLAPEPYRGKLNSPSLLPNTVKCLAGLRELDFEAVARITTNNFYNLFKFL